MNRPVLTSSIFDLIDQVPSPKWLGVAATLAALVLLVGLIVLSDRYLRLRRRIAEQGETGAASAHAGIAGWEDELSPISLEGERRAPVDRLLPRRPRTFLLAVGVLAVACWAAGLALTTDVYAFLASREWQLQPVYLAAHFITLRLFATMYTRNYLAGVVHLDMPTAHARRGIQLVQGPVGTLIALLVAIPFSLYDYQALGIAKGGTRTGGAGPAVDQLLYAMWCVEWFLMGFIWVQLVGFLFLTRRAIGDYRFRSPIEVVLLEKQYRHFLAMSAHGATIVLGFFLVNVVYGWYTGAEVTDYIGVAITLVLLVVGFIPPWMQLTSKMDRIVKEEMAGLRRRLASSEMLSLTDAGPAPGGAETKAAADLQARLDEALVMLRISYLERLHRDLGNMEAWSIVMKIGVPVMTVIYYAVHIYKAS
jgi:hypothetical protein